ncbi:MAG: nucleotidyltransferase family protein [Sulfitobacter sp.]|nr:nucleotidyltransferase family protein [Sulfitobacter sp.]
MRQLPVMIFAAGFGTRMGDLTRDRPKPLIEVAGKPLIDHTLDTLRAAGADRVVANLHYLPQPLIAHLEQRAVTWVLEEPDILDTGGGLRNALPLLGEGPVMTSNSDAIWAGPNPAEMLLEAWEPERMDALLVCIPMERVVGRAGEGDFDSDETGRLTRGAQMVYGGLQIIKTGGLAEIDRPAFSLNLMWDRIGAEGRLFGLNYPGHWCDVGHPGGIALAEDMLERHDV